MKKLVLIFLFIFSFNIIPVFADSYENVASYYNFDFSESSIPFDLEVDQTGTTLNSLFNRLTSFNSDYYYVYLSLNHYVNGFDRVKYYLIPKNTYSYLDSAYLGVNGLSTYQYSRFVFTTQTFTGCSGSITFNSSNIFSSSSYTTFIDYLDNGNCNLTNNIFINEVIYPYSRNGIFTNTSSNNIVFPSANNVEYAIPFYSNITLVYSNNVSNSYVNSYNSFYKTININDSYYYVNDNLPLYYDLYLSPNKDFDNYDEQLNRVFVGNIPKANINDLTIDLEFRVNSTEFTNNINIISYFFGRIDHGTYYSYEKINCSANTVISSFAISDNLVEGQIFPYGVTCSSDLTSYDYIYTRVDVLPNGSVDYTTYNLELGVNYGNIHNFSTINTNSYGIKSMFIYEQFNNLDPHFSIMLSSNSVGSAYYISDNRYVVSNYISTQTFDTVYNYSTYGNMTKTIYNIFNYYDYYQGSTNLKLFIDGSTIISFGVNNTYTYYDYDNNLITGTYDNDYIYSLDDSYDITYYFNIINNYIDSLSDDIYDFAVIVQSSYNIIPEPFSTLILVFFVLGCMYMIFRLIKR